ncbi:HD domain-containing protein [uncultured Vagococcus sp.]|uniref:HD domain-containing protein n=1 Tax=uncultured Vagococcus sp. TaxID=189676 RepID=UPI0028D06EE2|nr:HD domain-containing protein [uncultured Vagococcus sp.]
MKQLIDYTREPLIGDLKQDVIELLDAYNQSAVAQHSIRVAEEAKGLCLQYGLPGEWGYTAGLLHDVSVIVPNEERVSLCQSLGMELFEEERKLPMILHQRLSKEMAETCFNIDNREIVEAIECHTTLRVEPSRLDLILFIADKIQWDQADKAPYLDGLLLALNVSLEKAALYYIEWMFAQGMPVKHPWVLEAKAWLNQ